MKFHLLLVFLFLICFQTTGYCVVKSLDDDKYELGKKYKSSHKNTPKNTRQEKTLESQVNEIVNRYLSQPGNVGLVVGLLNDTSTVYLSYGLMEANGFKKPDKNTLFEIGSITKPFTALLALELERKNKLNLNDTITQYLPDSLTNEHLKNITLKKLLLHTAQLPLKPFNLSLTSGNNNNPYKNYTNQHLLEYLNVFKPIKRKKKLSFKTSNLGYGVLGLAMQKATGKPFKNLLAKHVIKPLTLKNTYLKIPENKKPNLAKPHSFNGKPTENYTYKSTMHASSGLYSCAEDLITLVKKQIQGGPASSISVSLQKCLNPQQKTNLKHYSVTYGWYHIYRGKRLPPVYIYIGGTAGYSSYIAFIKETGTAVVVLSNSANPVDEIAARLIQLLNY